MSDSTKWQGELERALFEPSHYRSTYYSVPSCDTEQSAKDPLGVPWGMNELRVDPRTGWNDPVTDPLDLSLAANPTIATENGKAMYWRSRDRAKTYTPIPKADLPLGSFGRRGWIVQGEGK